MVKEWTQGLVDAMVEYMTIPRDLHRNRCGGAVKRVGELDTAFPHRNAEIMIVLSAGWMDPAQDEEGIAAVRANCKAIEPHSGGYYDNIDFEGDRGGGNYGPAYERLRRSRVSTTRATCSA